MAAFLESIPAAPTTISPRRWLSARHTLVVEAALVAGLYASYQTGRALVAGDRGEAIRHAHEVDALEAAAHVNLEAHVQHFVALVPGAISLLGDAYLTFHLAVTSLVLVWLHRRRPEAFALVRTTLLLASGIALVVFLGFPTAPPRLSGVGIADTLSRAPIDVNHGLVSALYNPYAALPSIHCAYAIVVGAAVFRYARGRAARTLGLAYPLFVVAVVVATGNHFVLDAAAGGLVAAASFAAAARLLARHPV